MSNDDELDFTKLSIAERLDHKNWKARVSGYEDLLRLFSSQDEKSPEFSKYLPNLKKIPIDSNVTAQEKGLAVVYYFVENASPTISSKIAPDLINGCLVKAQLSSRVKTKELVSDIILMFIEIEKQDVVYEELLKCLESKTPKVVVGSVSLIRESIKQFSNKIYKLGPLLKVLPSLLEHKDPNIREESKHLTVEIFKWIKDALKASLSSIKPVLLNELEEEFNKIRNEKPKQLRYLRSEQIRVEDVKTVDTEIHDTGEKELINQEVDPYEFYEPVEILSKIPDDFYNKIEAKKWQERKEALEGLQNLMAPHPKLASGDYSELVKGLKKLVGKDANVVVVGVAAKCLADLANKLRKGFHSYSHSCIVIVLEKLKEKKQNVVTSLREAIDSIMLSTTLEAVIEDIVAALDNKNPQIRSETASFLTRYCANTDPASWHNKKLLNTLIEGLMKALNYPDPTVRESSAETIGTIMKIMGDKQMSQYLNDVDSLKMAKIKEYYEKAEVKYFAPVITAPPKPKPAPVKPIKTQEPKSEAKVVKPKSVSKSIPKPETKTMTKLKAPGKMNDKSLSNPNKMSNSNETLSLPLLPINNLKEQRLSDEKALKVLKWNFTTPREEFFVQLREQMTQANWNETLINNCFHSNFKMHLKAVESLYDFINEGKTEATLCNIDLILKWVALRFSDTNPSVILKILDYLIRLFQAIRDSDQKFSEQEAQSFIPYLIQKTGDPKDVFRQKVHTILEIIREIYSQQKLFAFIIAGLASKNARQRATCLDELGFLISIYGLGVCQPSAAQALKDISKQIGDKDSTVRNAALNCIVAAHHIEGEKIFKLVGTIPDKDMAMLEERIKRAVKTKPNLKATSTLRLDCERANKEIREPGMIKMASTSALKSESEKAKVEIAKGFTKTISTPSIRSNNRFGTITKPTQFAAMEMKEYEEDDEFSATEINKKVNDHLYSNRGNVSKFGISKPFKENGQEDYEIQSTPMRSIRKPHESSSKSNGIKYGTITKTASYKTGQVHEYGDIDFITPPNQVRRAFNSGTITKHKPNGGHLFEDTPKEAGNQHNDRVSSSPINENNDMELDNELQNVSIETKTHRKLSSPLNKQESPASVEKRNQLLNLVLAQLTSMDIPSVIDSLNQLKNILEKPERAEQHLHGKIDQIVMLCNMQYKYLMQKYINDSLDNNTIWELLQIVNLTLGTIFDHDSLRNLVTRDVLKDLISTIISLILDERVKSIGDEWHILKSNNRLATKIVVRSDPTSMLCSLIRLLHESVLGSNHCRDQYVDLLMKCIWKMCRKINDYFDKLDIDSLMLEVNLFLERFPYEYWKTVYRAHDDVPLRTVRTVIYLIVERVKENIFDHLGLIPNRESTELYSYIQRALRQLKKESNSHSSVPNNETSPYSKENCNELSNSDLVYLKSIINKLGTPNTEEGFELLNDFCRTHPNFDVGKYLKNNSSEFFITFVLDGLNKLQENKKYNGRSSLSPKSEFKEVPSKNVLTSNERSGDNIVNPLSELKSSREELEEMTKFYKNLSGQDVHMDLSHRRGASLREVLRRDEEYANKLVNKAKKASEPYLSEH